MIHEYMTAVTPITPTTNPVKALQARRHFLLQEIANDADEISKIDANLKLLEDAIHA